MHDPMIPTSRQENTTSSTKPNRSNAPLNVLRKLGLIELKQLEHEDVIKWATPTTYPCNHIGPVRYPGMTDEQVEEWLLEMEKRYGPPTS